jgi:hypothetical protein
MRKKLRVISVLILIGLIDPMLEHLEAESRRISSDTFFGCRDLDYYKTFTNYAVQKDMEAFTKGLTDGLLLGKCTLFKSGEEVFLVDTAFSPGLIKLRRKGDTVEYWTIIEATK